MQYAVFPPPWPDSPEEIKNAKAKALKPPTRGSEELAATIAILLLIETKGEYPLRVHQYLE